MDTRRVSKHHVETEYWRLENKTSRMRALRGRRYASDFCFALRSRMPSIAFPQRKISIQVVAPAPLLSDKSGLVSKNIGRTP